MDTPSIKIIENPSKELQEFDKGSSGLKVVPEIYNGSEEKSISRDTGAFIKWLNNHESVKIEYDPNAKKISLNNNEYWLPLVYLASDTSVQVYLGMVTNYLYDKLKGSLKGEKEKTKVHIKLECKDGDKYKKFTYDGNIEGLERIKKIDANEFMKD